MERPTTRPWSNRSREIGVNSAVDLFSTYAGQKSDLGPGRGAEINHDRDLRLQYLAGWGINSLLEDFLYRRMLSFRQMPIGIFAGSAERVSAVMAAIREGR